MSSAFRGGETDEVGSILVHGGARHGRSDALEAVASDECVPAIETLTATTPGLPLAIPRRRLRKRHRIQETQTPEPIPALTRVRTRAPKRHQAPSDAGFYVQARPLRFKVSRRYLLHLAKHAGPERIWNILVAGHYHHGKTSLIDLLVSHQLHPAAASRYMIGPRRHQQQPRWTDTRRDELSRGMSLQLAFMPLWVPDEHGVSQLVTLMDAPGHADFFDQVVVGATLADAVLLVVDSAEGVLLGTERVVALALEMSLPLILVLTQLDRLILELRYPPDAVYLKLKGIIDALNSLIERLQPQKVPYFDPRPPHANVLFTSAKLNIAFSLMDIVEKWYGSALEVQRERSWTGGVQGALRKRRARKRTLAASLWGDRVYDKPTGLFLRKAAVAWTLGTAKRSFVEFVLEPLYKTIALCATHESGSGSLEQLLVNVQALGTPRAFEPQAASSQREAPTGLEMLQQAADSGPWALLRVVFEMVLGSPTALFGTLTRRRRHSKWFPEHCAETETTVLVATHWRSLDGTDTVAVGRVCGARPLRADQLFAVQPGADRCKPSSVTTTTTTMITQLQVAFGRVWYDVEQVSAGGLVLLPRVYPPSRGTYCFGLRCSDGPYSKTLDACVYRLHRALGYHAMPIYGIALAPCLPEVHRTAESLTADLVAQYSTSTASAEQLRQALAIIVRTHPATGFDGNGSIHGDAAHGFRTASTAGVVYGPGELYLDVILHELRRYLVQRHLSLVWRCLRTNPVPFVDALRETIQAGAAKVQVGLRGRDGRTRSDQTALWSSPKSFLVSEDEFFSPEPSEWSDNEDAAFHQPRVVLYVEPVHASRRAPAQQAGEANAGLHPVVVHALHPLPNSVRFERRSLPAEAAVQPEALEVEFAADLDGTTAPSGLPVTLQALWEGLRLASRRGPLLQGPVVGVRYHVRALECICGSSAWEAPPPCWSAWHRMRTRLVLLARQAAHRALLDAKMQILEPCFRLQAVVRAEKAELICRRLRKASELVEIRQQCPIPGTCFVIVDSDVPARVLVPGLEVMLRFQSHGQASVQATVDPAVMPTCSARWIPVPGDADSVECPPLEAVVASDDSTVTENTLAPWLVRIVRMRRGLGTDL